MKQFFVLNILLLSFSFNLNAQKLDAFVTVNRFYQAEAKEQYVEIAYLVPAGAVNYVLTKDKKYQAKLKVNFNIDNQKGFVNNKTYVLQTPLYQNLNDVRENLSDVIRLNTPAKDTIVLSIRIEDVNDSSFYETKMDVYIPETREAFLSDIMLINQINAEQKNNAFSRNNMVIVPKFLNYYPTEVNEIRFYTEFYQLTKKENYLVSYLITNEEGLYVDGYAAHKKIIEKDYEAIIGGFDISKLPSGNYYLFVELKDSKNEAIERKRTFFQRNNKNKDVVENKNLKKNELDVITNNFAKKYDLRNIKHHILALDPIADYFERASIIGMSESEDLVQMQNYFYSFWTQRNAKDPEAAWKEYAEKLQYVEKTFNNMNNSGYETARGRVYLKYGKPYREKLNRSGDQGEFWVWNYESIEGQSDVYFIFVNRNKVTDDFVLVHTSLRGQLYDKVWAEYLKNEF